MLTSGHTTVKAHLFPTCEISVGFIRAYMINYDIIIIALVSLSLDFYEILLFVWLFEYIFWFHL